MRSSSRPLATLVATAVAIGAPTAAAASVAPSRSLSVGDSLAVAAVPGRTATITLMARSACAARAASLRFDGGAATGARTVAPGAWRRVRLSLTVAAGSRRVRISTAPRSCRVALRAITATSTPRPVPPAPAAAPAAGGAQPSWPAPLPAADVPASSVPMVLRPTTQKAPPAAGGAPSAPTPPPPARPRLGSALGAQVLGGADPRYAPTYLANFESMTPENEMKMDALQPARGSFSFATADAMVDWARARGKTVRGHTLVWHNQLPEWLTSRSWTRDELREVLREHVQSVVTHFRGRVAEWDVVNEPLEGDGTLRSNLWMDVIGPSYVEDALRWARAADPAARLYVNDFSTERLNAKSDGLLALAGDLRERSVPLDGVGFQTHVSTSWHPSPGELEVNLRRFAALGLDVGITELDVADLGHDLAAQAAVYRDVAAACRAVAACRGVTTWGISDAMTWLGSASAPLPFDASYAPKPAWPALLAGLGRS